MYSPIHDVLLQRRGRVFIHGTSQELNVEAARVVAVKLSRLGYLPNTRLQQRLEQTPIDELTALQEWAWTTLAKKAGDNQKHVPLFRKFPQGLPRDTAKLWWEKVLCHFLQGEDQPCLFCGRTGTTHILSPCHHVVCDNCFDGSNYSACPICERHVNQESPFFQADEERTLPKEQLQFRLLELGTDVDKEAKAMFLSFCARQQVLSPIDQAHFATLIEGYGELAIDWIPESIPVKENVALVFGALLRNCDQSTILPLTKPHMSTATDVLRLLVAFSGADPALQGQTTYQRLTLPTPLARWWGKLARLLGTAAAKPQQTSTLVPLEKKRFRVAPLSRSLRRTLLGWLDELNPQNLTEDMLRHRSYWVWLGEFLHPHEYAKRYPNVALAFTIVRQKDPHGTAAPKFQSYYGHLEASILAQDHATVAKLLRQRPGELARHFDHAIRLGGDNREATDELLSAFVNAIEHFSTPVLLTLYAHLPHRLEPVKVRVFWPKGAVTTGYSVSDKRVPLAPEVMEPALDAVTTELLRRFSDKQLFNECIVDADLKTIVAPFNERTASKSDIALPRGSHIAFPAGKTVRLFLHWCQPRGNSCSTDLDLSVGFYDDKWNYKGVCSYYELSFCGADQAVIAESAGDLQDAPYPDGATEFVDLHRHIALKEGIRYAAMVVNAYAGLPFDLLDRGFAGVMLRDDVMGQHFDPRTVKLKFDLKGSRGVFVPLVLDIKHNRLHWLDVYATGMLKLNNVETSNRAITTVCPNLIEYFGSGTRISMYELALLHGAARARQVLIRGEANSLFIRKNDESAQAFFERLKSGSGTAASGSPSGTSPVLAALFRSNLDLPPDSACYALFDDNSIANLSASDLI
ncbi:MAG: hypothetical protein HN348_10480 [Proteobacteria bacterium]|jgi:hypothetical protein|nr:hypothetical protein [Pseudomonadota bacterium]